MACLSLAACGPSEEGPRPEEPLSEQRAEVTSATADPLSADLAADIGRVLLEGNLPVMGDTDFLDNHDPNLLVQQNNTEVFITFVSSRAQNNNTLLYFTYPEGQAPTSPPALSQSNVVFGSLGGLTSGTRVSLGVFNAGTRVGYALVSNGGATTPPDLSKPRFYSLAGLNSGNVQFISKYHKAEQRRVVGVEDTAVATSDQDYNDAVFIASSTPREIPLCEPERCDNHDNDCDGVVDNNCKAFISDFKWSTNGKIAGMFCTQIFEALDGAHWQDNYLCAKYNYQLRYASAGPVSGMNCVRFYEPSDPNSWQDNYLCTSYANPFQWNYTGPIGGKHCLLMNEPSDGAHWQDNHLCTAHQ
jgi:hypothetical protein